MIVVLEGLLSHLQRLVELPPAGSNRMLCLVLRCRVAL